MKKKSKDSEILFHSNKLYTAIRKKHTFSYTYFVRLVIRSNKQSGKSLSNSLSLLFRISFRACAPFSPTSPLEKSCSNGLPARARLAAAPAWVQGVQWPRIGPSFSAGRRTAP